MRIQSAIFYTVVIVSVKLLVLATTVLVSSGVTVDDLANLELLYENLGYNIEPSLTYSAKLTLTNTGGTDIDTGSEDVSIYVCLIRSVKI